MHYFSNVFFDKEIYMFRTDLMSIIGSLNTVYSSILTLIADSQHN
jgi:hypothetical protein